MILKYLVWFAVNIFAIGASESSSSEEVEDGDDLYRIGDMYFSRKIDEMRRNTRAGATHIEYQGQDYDLSWPNNTIPYTWSPTISAEKKSMIQSAMKDIMNAVPNCWKFVQKTSAHAHWVEYDIDRLPNECSSSVGNLAIAGKSPQYINFGAEHCKYGSMVHELFHTMGFLHEMTSNDRDDYIEVYMDRIPTEYHNNFILDYESHYKTNFYDIPYNFESLMHYGFNLVGMIQNPVMRNKRNQQAIGWDLPDEKVGQRYYISKGDLLMMARKGKCPDPNRTYYPVTGATSNDIGISEDIQICMDVLACTNKPKARPEGSKPKPPGDKDKKSPGTGRCGLISMLCCDGL